MKEATNLFKKHWLPSWLFNDHFMRQIYTHDNFVFVVIFVTGLKQLSFVEYLLYARCCIVILYHDPYNETMSNYHPHLTDGETHVNLHN